jgi:hypothetical protein
MALIDSHYEGLAAARHFPGELYDVRVEWSVFGE